ncbi:hypothetical protein D9Q81_09170 [Candidatus Korarchaeum cryptofilum]|jgi:hypothetical protein|uniref:Nucleotidyltransferase family protein n=1 Tax=Candidatus Korarchaeum cryptofilum TaxID=498846 RepID=A0A3R9PCG4_9CREN|nr:nucleotidyltransferase [Candidatus Korarchaeum cryptofilum]RSN67041.1 hypothetical protein D9Q81_09170 [Candidatus Korarchaeum cryptofilum]
MSSLNDFLDATDALKLRYALLGALAVRAWNPYRKTHDVDVAIEKSDFWKLKNFLAPLGYFVVENPRLGKLELKHRYKGDIDVYTDEVSGIRVSDLLKRSVERELEGRRVRVVSPEDLIILKAKAGRERDMADISVVLVNLKDDLDWNYLKERASSLKIDLKSFLLRSLERIPVYVENVPKVRKSIKKIIEERL